MASSISDLTRRKALASAAFWKWEKIWRRLINLSCYQNQAIQHHLCDSALIWMWILGTVCQHVKQDKCIPYILLQDHAKYQAPDSETSLMPVFFSFTCFRPSGATQQQLGFWISTSGFVWKWRLKWRNSGSPIERSVAHGTLIDAPRHASPWQQRKRHQVRGVLRDRSNAQSVRKLNKAVLEPRVSPAFAITYFCNHFYI